MNRITAILTASMVLLGGCCAIASAAPVAGSNAGVTEYQQKTTVPVTQKNKGDKDQGVQGVSGSGGNPGNSGSGSSSPEATQSGSSGVAGLAFTGFDVLALAGIGALLVLAGFAQRRFIGSRRHA
jgi:hypothetical protein